MAVPLRVFFASAGDKMDTPAGVLDKTCEIGNPIQSVYFVVANNSVRFFALNSRFLITVNRLPNQKVICGMANTRPRNLCRAIISRAMTRCHS